jgi:type I restriction enzyme S subunit
MLYYTLEQDAFFDYVMAGSNGVKMPRGDKEWIMNYPVVIPSKVDILHYQEMTDCIRKQNVCSKQENDKLTELQSLLLARMGK